MISTITYIIHDDIGAEVFKKDIEVSEFAAESAPISDLLGASFRMIERATYEHFGVK